MPSFSEDKKYDELKKSMNYVSMKLSMEGFFQGQIYAACNAYRAEWISNSKKVKLIEAARKKFYADYPEPIDEVDDSVIDAEKKIMDRSIIFFSASQ